MGTRLHRDDPRRPPTLAQRYLEDALGEDLRSILLRLLPFYSQEEIGKMFGIHHSTVSRWLHRLGINRAPDGRTWWEVRKNSRMRIRGKMLGIHHSTVSRWLRRLGIDRAPDGRTWWEVRKNSRMRILGEILGIHHSTVSRWLRRLGIDRAPDGRTWWEVRKNSRMRIRGGRIADDITHDATLEGLDARSES